MPQALRHRGPDGFGIAVWDGRAMSLDRSLDESSRAALIHNRLSIIDLSETGRQPMQTPDGRYTLDFNGEIYNYRELREKLIRDHGCTFIGQSDSEVLLHALATWDLNCLNQLVGMFAFALIDSVEKSLTLARDQVGIKPLWTAVTDAGLAFCSEPAPLLTWPGVNRQADPQGVVDYLRFGFTDHRESALFSNLTQVRPGHVAIVPLDGPFKIDSKPYWAAVPRPELALNFDQASKRLRELLLESVDLHLRSDVPVASCLSGGIDSSSIVCMMRHVGGSKLDIHTFSHIAPGTAFDEQEWIDAINELTSARSHKVQSTAEDLVRDLPELVKTQQTPFSTTSIYAQRRVFESLHAEGIKVTLDGQGADELFGGYSFHIGARIGSLLKAGRLGAAQKLLKTASLLPGTSQKMHLGNALDYLLPSSLQTLARRGAGKDLVPPWLNEDWMRTHDVASDPYRTSRSKFVLKEALCRSLEGPGLPHVLRYEDRNSMAFSVEARVPFLSLDVMEFALSLPEAFLVSDQAQTKTLLRAAMRDIVPDSILDRKDKIAFQTPEADWFRVLQPWMDGVLSSEAASRVTPLDLDMARSHWENVKSGSKAYTSVVWRWVNLIEWARQFDVTFD